VVRLGDDVGSEPLQLTADKISGRCPLIRAAVARSDDFPIQYRKDDSRFIVLIVFAFIFAEIRRPNGEMVVLFDWCVG
jgi:hypothetical protein